MSHIYFEGSQRIQQILSAETSRQKEQDIKTFGVILKSKIVKISEKMIWDKKEERSKKEAKEKK